MNHTDKENYNKPFSKEELTQAIQSTKTSPTGPDKIHNEMLKHFWPERLDSLLALFNKIWQQGFFPEKGLEFTIKPNQNKENTQRTHQIIGQLLQQVF